jgi:hypothetical protein
MSLPRKTMLEPTSVQDMILDEGVKVKETPHFFATHHSVPEVLKIAEIGCLLCSLEYGNDPLNLQFKAQKDGPWIIEVVWERTDNKYQTSGLDHMLVHDCSGSLCIIQDVICARCTLNIVAADASDRSVGCFLERKSNQALGFKAILPDSGDGKRVTNWNVINSPSQEWISRTITSNRAWCL